VCRPTYALFKACLKANTGGAPDTGLYSGHHRNAFSHLSAYAFIDSLRAGEAAFVPYIDLALAGVGVFEEAQGHSVEFSGSGITARRAFKYFFQRNLSLDLALQIGFMSIDEASGGGQSIDLYESATTVRFNLGLSWFPMR